MTPVALALGGNAGLVEAAFDLALGQLGAVLGRLRVASLYRSRAVSPIAQPDYLNTAAIARTTLSPEDLLGFAKALELAAGRRRGRRLGPRPLDIDLLLYDGLRSDDPALTLPHPRLAERRFVLAPLAEIAPDLPVPPAGITIAELLRRLPTEPPVERLAWSHSPAGTAPH
ncbi:MAG TPA: 2-amino-4-hydroxy-6-hydroxymethyldihydropteridine diphosphokinase [Thermoanaerobaculia bacterium]|nr:2-amino-4-hydroxy-6-hydroxymethyldihydropteridine diphosphokinase [Thermoanaerobaculia bacterium]